MVNALSNLSILFILELFMKKTLFTFSSERRAFLINASTISLLICATATVAAQDMLSENDAQATALGYKADANNVDKTIQPKYVAGQACSNCALYRPSGSAAGMCTLFTGKQVSAKAWCNAWAKAY